MHNDFLFFFVSRLIPLSVVGGVFRRTAVLGVVIIAPNVFLIRETLIVSVQAHLWDVVSSCLGFLDAYWVIKDVTIWQ